MKYCIVVLAVIGLASATWTPRNKEEFYKDRDNCLETLEVGDASKDLVRKNEFAADSGCYYRCIGLKAEIWDDTTGYDLDRSLEQIAAEGLQVNKEDYSKCLTDEQKSDKPCEWAANVMKCVWAHKYVTKKE